MPEAAIEAETELVKVTLQMLFVYTVIGPQEEGFRVGNQDMDPAQSAAVLVKNLELMDVPIA